VAYIFSRQDATKHVAASDTFSVNLGPSVPTGFRLKEVVPDGPPALFQYLMDSDYVVIAEGGEPKVIGKRSKKPLLPNQAINLEDSVVGSVYVMQVEELLFSKEAFDNNQNLNAITTRFIEIFKEIRKLNDPSYDAGTRYLLFLKKIPKSEEVFTTLELDITKDYFRPYSGKTSIFLEPPGLEGHNIEGAYNKGIINLNNEKYSKLVRQITEVCKALSVVDNKERLRNAIRLAKSNDPVLRNNAEYAIDFLSRTPQK
jgi:hypothetical protein